MDLDPAPWRTAHIKLAAATVGVLLLVSLVSRQCSAGASAERNKVEVIVRECERLAEAGDHPRAAGGLWALQKLSDDRDVAANPVALTLDQVRRVSKLSLLCQHALERDKRRKKPTASAKKKKRLPASTASSLRDVFAMQAS